MPSPSLNRISALLTRVEQRVESMRVVDDRASAFLHMVELLDAIAIAKSQRQPLHGEALEFWQFIRGHHHDGAPYPEPYFSDRISWPYNEQPATVDGRPLNLVVDNDELTGV
jgi:hypothetical protein